MSEKGPEDQQPLQPKKPFWDGWTGKEFSDWLIQECEKRGLYGRVKPMQDRPLTDTQTFSVSMRPASRNKKKPSGK